jgi:hypothetical protein
MLEALLGITLEEQPQDQDQPRPEPARCSTRRLGPFAKMEGAHCTRATVEQSCPYTTTSRNRLIDGHIQVEIIRD